MAIVIIGVGRLHQEEVGGLAPQLHTLLLSGATRDLKKKKKKETSYLLSDKGCAKASSALELDVRDADAGVDDVDHHALTGGLVEQVGCLAGPGLGFREPLQSEGRVYLLDGGTGVNPLIGLNVRDLVGPVDVGYHGVVGVEGHGTPLVHLERHDVGGELPALKASLVQVAFLDGGREERHLGINSLAAKGAVVHHNVTVGDDVGGIGNGDWKDGIGRNRAGRSGSGSNELRPKQDESQRDGSNERHDV